MTMRTATPATARVVVRKKPRRPKMDLGRETVFRCPAYLVLVRKLPCSVCGKKGYTQAAHSNQLRFGKGKGLKGSDAAAFPLCGTAVNAGGCHAAHDQGGWMQKDEWHAFEYDRICGTVEKLIKLGHLAWDLEPDDLQDHTGDTEALAVYLVNKIETNQLRVVR
jgi:hypothetical protein